jgi:hypothetical protein
MSTIDDVRQLRRQNLVAEANSSSMSAATAVHAVAAGAGAGAKAFVGGALRSVGLAGADLVLGFKRIVPSDRVIRSQESDQRMVAPNVSVLALTAGTALLVAAGASSVELNVPGLGHLSKPFELLLGVPLVLLGCRSAFVLTKGTYVYCADAYQRAKQAALASAGVVNANPAG